MFGSTRQLVTKRYCRGLIPLFRFNKVCLKTTTTNDQATPRPALAEKDIDSTESAISEAGSSSSSEIAQQPTSKTPPARPPLSTVEQAKLEKYNRLKDASHMKPYHRMVLHDEIVPPNMFKWQSERWALRQRYAQYGKASGVNPKYALLWPTLEELQDIKDEEAFFNPSLEDTINAYKTKVATDEQNRKDRIAEVDAKLRNYRKDMDAYRKSLKAKEEEMSSAERKKEDKIREIQEYFGYAVDPKDPRFQAMMEKKEEEEKKAMRLQKKIEKKAKLIASVTQDFDASSGPKS